MKTSIFTDDYSVNRRQSGGAASKSLFKATSLDPFMIRPAGKLSGGMKQKLSLCCALIHDPDLLILDEPTTGVDPLSRGQFWELINAIRARRPQMSVIVATAYMDEAARFDWLVAMDAGKIIATGTTPQILQKTGEKDLEAAFIALLPEAERAQAHKVVMRPRSPSDEAFRPSRPTDLPVASAPSPPLTMSASASPAVRSSAFSAQTAAANQPR